MTMPVSEQDRKRAVPAGLVLHFGELHDQDRSWYGGVPVTSPRRTLLDCVASELSPDLLEQALEQAVDRGLLDVAGIRKIAQGIDALTMG